MVTLSKQFLETMSHQLAEKDKQKGVREAQLEQDIKGTLSGCIEWDSDVLRLLVCLSSYASLY